MEVTWIRRRIISICTCTNAPEGQFVRPTAYFLSRSLSGQNALLQAHAYFQLEFRILLLLPRTLLTRYATIFRMPAWVFENISDSKHHQYYPENVVIIRRHLETFRYDWFIDCRYVLDSGNLSLLKLFYNVIYVP